MSSRGTQVGLGLAGAGMLAGFAWSSEETRQSVEWAWTFLLRLIEQGPASLKTLPLAVLAGWLVMLRVSTLPMRCMSPVGASLVAQLAGGVAAFWVVWMLWREPFGLIVGAIIALSTPATWALFLILLEVCPAEWSRRWAAELRGEGRQVELFRQKR